eukprot:CAMPEP_0202877372 /NCGR_PEP_ID=MMETSP1391-20130828/30541_1 /ASSEMBLY_ACC=CAM_ASM_000867 /TAXON_ID=1034604 /ORGANISM="Chlamydomonas leiostraca, Strain SAG 11-49" /LENGTH=215 /DNA_ID=CAMNT_0049559399 /DNA_START=391 /DNA_END=1038 /DNA_ORIENTATION=-
MALAELPPPPSSSLPPSSQPAAILSALLSLLLPPALPPSPSASAVAAVLDAAGAAAAAALGAACCLGAAGSALLAAPAALPPPAAAHASSHCSSLSGVVSSYVEGRPASASAACTIMHVHLVFCRLHSQRTVTSSEHAVMPGQGPEWHTSLHGCGQCGSCLWHGLPQDSFCLASLRATSALLLVAEPDAASVACTCCSCVHGSVTVAFPQWQGTP